MFPIICTTYCVMSQNLLQQTWEVTDSTIKEKWTWMCVSSVKCKRLASTIIRYLIYSNTGQILQCCEWGTCNAVVTFIWVLWPRHPCLLKPSAHAVYNLLISSLTVRTAFPDALLQTATKITTLLLALKLPIDSKIAFFGIWKPVLIRALRYAS